MKNGFQMQRTDMCYAELLGKHNQNLQSNKQCKINPAKIQN